MDGFVFSVQTVDQENELRRYEGDSYEIVRARVVIDGKEEEGRVFRFGGYEDDLDG